MGACPYRCSLTFVICLGYRICIEKVMIASHIIFFVTQRKPINNQLYGGGGGGVARENGAMCLPSDIKETTVNVEHWEK